MTKRTEDDTDGKGLDSQEGGEYDCGQDDHQVVNVGGQGRPTEQPERVEAGGHHRAHGKQDRR